MNDTLRRRESHPLATAARFMIDIRTTVVPVVKLDRILQKTNNRSKIAGIKRKSLLYSRRAASETRSTKEAAPRIGLLKRPGYAERSVPGDLKPRPTHRRECGREAFVALIQAGALREAIGRTPTGEILAAGRRLHHNICIERRRRTRRRNPNVAAKVC